MNQAANNLMGQVAAILVGTDFDVVDALEAMNLHTAGAARIETIILGNEVQRCPLCEVWVWNTDIQWNSHKGCCTDCAELGG